MKHLYLPICIPPPEWAALIIAAIAAFMFAACVTPLEAHAAESELGIAYVQHRFADETSIRETTPHRAYATYSGDRQSYTARINASG